MSRGLLHFPREVIRNIALHIYDPLDLTQQDRLTWGIFSTVDMHQERQDDLASLVAFGQVCRKVRREARIILFRCIRTPTIEHVRQVIQNRDGWSRYVKSIIIDLTMFDHDEWEPDHGPPTLGRRGRSCWSESTLLLNLINSLPCLHHMSFFADASDDSTLALLFAALIPHPSSHSIPPPTVPSSPCMLSAVSGYSPPLPLTARLRSFGWRQRAPPPHGLRSFSQSSTFVSTLHLLRHAHRLSFLVLDADLDEMHKEDILTACKELALREAPIGEPAEKVSLMLCGPIKGWSRGFLTDLVETFHGVKELFIDKPLRKSTVAHETTIEAFISLVEPLSRLPHLSLLQVGSYTFSAPTQTVIAFRLASLIPSLHTIGLLGEKGDTNWWGLWRRVKQRTAVPIGEYHERLDVKLVPLGDGHLKELEKESERQRKASLPTPSELQAMITPPDSQDQIMEDESIVEGDAKVGVDQRGDDPGSRLGRS